MPDIAAVRNTSQLLMLDALGSSITHSGGKPPGALLHCPRMLCRAGP